MRRPLGSTSNARSTIRGRRSDPRPAFSAALERTRTPWLVVLPCDMPFVDSDGVCALIAAASGAAVEAAVWRKGGATEPFPLAIRARSTAPVRRWIESGGRKILDLLERVPSVIVDVSKVARSSDDRIFRNLNTPAEFREVDPGGGSANPQPIG